MVSLESNTKHCSYRVLDWTNTELPKLNKEKYISLPGEGQGKHNTVSLNIRTGSELWGPYSHFLILTVKNIELPEGQKTNISSQKLLPSSYSCSFKQDVYIGNTERTLQSNTCDTFI